MIIFIFMITIPQVLLSAGADTDDYLDFHLPLQVLLSAGADTELWTATGCCGTALHLAAAIADKQVGEFCWLVTMMVGIFAICNRRSAT